ncbi:MAG: IPT/TIG domain-containing protein [Janthinobacterium lividum]
MKLLHPEVEVLPGTPGKRPTTQTPEREKLVGSVILRLTNDTPQENAYTVRLRCDHPFWQESWYTVTSHPPLGANPAAGGKPDIPGHSDRSVKVFVPRGASRDIFIRFNVLKKPECRAGRYDYTIEVETQVTLAQEGAARRKDRLTTLHAVANVRPFYKWSVDLTPEQRRVGRRHKTGEFEVVVTNEGNDWLYCDLQLPRPKDLLLDCPTLRLAVPPPEPGEMLPTVGVAEGRAGTQRSVPLLATTKLKLFRGDVTAQPLSVSALRVDAPSLSAPAEDGYASLGSVVAEGTNESQPAPSDRALLYAPPIPAKLVDFFTRGAGSFRAWIAPLLLLMIAIPAAFVVAQHIWFAVKINNFGTVGTSNLAEAGKPLIISGKYVIGSHVSITTEPNGKGQTLYEEDSKEVKDVLRSTGGPGAAKFDRCSITLPAALNHKSGYLVVQRLGAVFPYLSAILPKDSKPIQIGDALVTHDPAVTPVEPGPYPVHGTFTIQGQNLGKTGFVLVGGQRAATTNWAPEQIGVTIPPTLPASPNPVDVSVRLASTAAPIDAGSITIQNPVAVAVSGAKTAATTGGSAKTASGGGTPPKTVKATTPPAVKTPLKQAVQVASNHVVNTVRPIPNITQTVISRPVVSNGPTAEDYLLRDNFQAALTAVNGQDTAYAHAVRAVAYAKTPGQLNQATIEVAQADKTASTPADKAMTFAAHGWIALQQKNFPQARTSFKQAVDSSPTPFVKASNAWGQPDINNVTSTLHALLTAPGLTPAAKQGLDFQYHKAYKAEME